MFQIVLQNPVQLNDSTFLLADFEVIHGLPPLEFRQLFGVEFFLGTAAALCLNDGSLLVNPLSPRGHQIGTLFRMTVEVEDHLVVDASNIAGNKRSTVFAVHRGVKLVVFGKKRAEY